MNSLPNQNHRVLGTTSSPAPLFNWQNLTTPTIGIQLVLVTVVCFLELLLAGLIRPDVSQPALVVFDGLATLGLLAATALHFRRSPSNRAKRRNRWAAGLAILVLCRIGLALALGPSAIAFCLAMLVVAAYGTLAPNRRSLVLVFGFFLAATLPLLRAEALSLAFPHLVLAILATMGVAVLSFQFRVQFQEMSQFEEQRIRDASEQLAEGNAQLARQAATDSLTGLPNRRGARAALRLMKEETPKHEKTFVLLLDLDHFKAVNDELGHRAGDRLLCQVADELEGRIGPNEFACRFGGDEFLVGIARTDHEQAMAEAKDMVAAIEAVGRSFSVSARPSVSIGVAHLPRTPGAVLASISWADHASYQAKSEGGNRAVWSTAGSEISTLVGSEDVGSNSMAGLSMHKLAEELAARDAATAPALAVSATIGQTQARLTTGFGAVGYLICALVFVAQGSTPTLWLLAALHFAMAMFHGGGFLLLSSHKEPVESSEPIAAVIFGLFLALMTGVIVATGSGHFLGYAGLLLVFTGKPDSLSSAVLLRRHRRPCVPCTGCPREPSEPHAARWCLLPGCDADALHSHRCLLPTL